MRDLPDDNLSYPVLLELGGGSGSGFYFSTSHKLFLVTALHVIENENKQLRDNNLKLTSYDKDLSIKTPIEILVDLTKVNIRKKDLKDIIMVELGSFTSTHGINFLNGVQVRASSHANVVVVPSESLKSFNDVLVANDVYILGYPKSLGMPNNPQIELNKPLLRKGIIAGKNTSNETIILDCPIYFGNSGGLAIEVEEINSATKKFSVIGVVSQYVPFVETLRSLQLGYENHNIENSGYSVVVPIDTIIELSAEAPSPSPSPSPSPENTDLV